MSAEIIDHPAVLRAEKPDIEKVLAVLSLANEDGDSDPFALLVGAITAAQMHRSKGYTLARAKAVANGFAIAWLALGEMLGIDQDEMLSFLI